LIPFDDRIALGAEFDQWDQKELGGEEKSDSADVVDAYLSLDRLRITHEVSLREIVGTSRFS
jgi:hypothetical protein